MLVVLTVVVLAELLVTMMAEHRDDKMVEKLDMLTAEKWAVLMDQLKVAAKV